MWGGKSITPPPHRRRLLAGALAGRLHGDLLPPGDTACDKQADSENSGASDAGTARCGEFLICGHVVPPRQLVEYAWANPTRSFLPSEFYMP
jgi:hypothetical protein